MTKATRRRPPILMQLLAVCIATAAALGLAEITLRLFVGPPQVMGALGFADTNGNPISGAKEAIAKGLIVSVPGEKPRPRTMFKPAESFYLSYANNDVLNRDWLDSKGRVLNSINEYGLRERPNIRPDKPAGERRIVCIGDSFTYGWGIPAEQGWVRLLEEDLRKDQGNVRTVNCGAAGTVCVDEYVAGLKSRFAKFQPDAVVMTLCLNDLVPSHGLSLIVPVESSGSRLLDMAKAAMGSSPINLDPEVDWVQMLLDMGQEEGTASGLYNHDKPFEAMWSQGVPQASMREAKAWCDQREIPFLVVIWPFLQGLGKGRHYPFQRLHDLVAEDLKQANIPLLDVLPMLRETNSEDLWVTPADPHPNPLAQTLTLPAITKFVRSHINR